MGYRSEIKAVVTCDYGMSDNRKQEVFKQIVGVVKLIAKEWVAEQNKWGATIGWSDGALVFQWEGVKWYDSYPDVQLFKELWGALSKIDGASGQFVRVGEEDGDIETMTFGDNTYDLVDVTTSISFFQDGLEEVGKRQEVNITEEKVK